MTHEIDYAAVDISSEKTAEEYHYTDRRAELLELIYQAGSPARMRQADLADRYGVNQSTISRDLDALAEYVDETLGDRRELNTQAVLKRSIDGLLEEGEWRKAATTALEYDEWVRETKDLEEMMDRIEQIEEQRERAKYR